jgi:hypothetical protein
MGKKDLVYGGVVSWQRRNGWRSGGWRRYIRVVGVVGGRRRCTWIGGASRADHRHWWWAEVMSSLTVDGDAVQSWRCCTRGGRRQRREGEEKRGGEEGRRGRPAAPPPPRVFFLFSLFAFSLLLFARGLSHQLIHLLCCPLNTVSYIVCN